LENRRRRQAKAKAARRQRQRQNAAESATLFDYQPGKNNDQSYRTLPPVTTDFASETLPFAGAGGWVGAHDWAKKNKQRKNRPKGYGSRKRFKTIRQLRLLADLLGEGFRYIKNDGE
jgi:hypothetical protein